MDSENDPELGSPLPSDQRMAANTGHQGGYEAFRERFEALIPTIQREWPDLARHTLEATRGSLDEVVAVIASHTGRTATAVQGQLLELLHVADEQTQRIAQNLDPFEDQLERLLDELDATLRPKLERPVRERPLLALGIAAGVGLLTGLLLSSARRSA
jgi:ElaB/YqjD/DUF883 family membrane-anchored ribosome-binding protein